MVELGAKMRGVVVREEVPKGAYVCEYPSIRARSEQLMKLNTPRMGKAVIFRAVRRKKGGSV